MLQNCLLITRTEFWESYLDCMIELVVQKMKTQDEGKLVFSGNEVVKALQSVTPSLF